jgi:organic hydroperoxide reductase OsmC/OhrA
MLIEATVVNERDRHEVVLSTGGTQHSVAIAPRASGFGSSANGGELLCLALASCYTNDIYREAAKLGIEVVRVEVVAQAEFGAAGEPASRLSYRVAVSAKAAESRIRELIVHTDMVAEVQNTLRRGMPVALESFEARSVVS